MGDQLQPGMTVYGRAGQRAEFVSMVDERYLVTPIHRYTEWDGEEYEARSDALELWDRVYLKPPVEVKSEEVSALQQEVAEAQRALLDIQQKVAEEQREYLETLKRLKRYKPLKNLEAILAGEITHVVEGSGYGNPKIRTWAEASVYRDDYSRKDVLRMLSLKPTADGDISWHLNRWKDGSGVDTQVFLCTSEEEAREAALWVTLDPLSRATYETHPHLWASALKSAERLGLTIPADVIAKGREYLRNQAQKRVDDAAEALAKAQADVDVIAAPSAA